MCTLILTCSCVLRVELPPSARRSEAHNPDNPQEEGSFIDLIISLLCGIICNEQPNKTEVVGKVYELILFYFIQFYK